jgi:hypothetical protein
MALLPAEQLVLALPDRRGLRYAILAILLAAATVLVLRRRAV